MSPPEAEADFIWFLPALTTSSCLHARELLRLQAERPRDKLRATAAADEGPREPRGGREEG